MVSYVNIFKTFFFFFFRSVRMSEKILCLNYGMCNFILHISLMYNLF